MKFKWKTLINSILIASGVVAVTSGSILLSSNIESPTNQINQNSNQADLVNNKRSALAPRQSNSTILKSSIVDAAAISSVNSIYPYNWENKTVIAEDFVARNLSLIFDGIDATTKVVGGSTDIISIDNINGSVQIQFKLINWKYEGQVVNNESNYYVITVFGFKKVTNEYAGRYSSEKNYESFFKFKEANNKKLASSVWHEIDLIDNNDDNKLLLKGKLGDNTLQRLSKYFYFGPIPQTDDFELLMQATPNNDNGEMFAYAEMSSYFNSINDQTCLYTNQPVNLNVDADGLFFAGQTAVLDSIIQLDTIAYDGYTLVDFAEQYNSQSLDPGVENKLKKEIASRIVVKETQTGKEYNGKYNATKIKVLPPTPGSGNGATSELDKGIVKIQVEINDWITSTNNKTEQFIFTICGGVITKPIITKNIYFPSLLTPEEVKAGLDADLNKSSYEEQSFVQLFLAIGNCNPNQIKISSYNLENDPEDKDKYYISFVIDNYPTIEGPITFTTEKFEYKHLTIKLETKLPQTIDVSSVLETTSINFEGNSSLALKNPMSFQMATDSNKIKEIIFNNIVNKPGPVSPDGSVDTSVFTTNDIDIDQNNFDDPATIAKIINNGELNVRVKLNKYLWVNPTTNNVEYVNQPKDFGVVKFVGLKKVFNATQVSVSNNFFNANPSYSGYKAQAFIDMFNQKSDNDKRLILCNMLSFYSYGFADNSGHIPDKFAAIALKDISSVRLTAKSEYTLNLSFNLEYALQSEQNGYVAKSKPYNIQINFYNNNDFLQTQIPTDIYYDNEAFANYDVFQFKDAVLNNTLDPQFLDSIKQDLVNNWIKFKPPSFNALNITNISINEVFPDPSEKVWAGAIVKNWPHVSMTVTLNSYYDGTNQPVSNPKPFTFNFYAPFKLIEDTRINEQNIFIQGVSNIKADEWKPSQDELAKALTDEIWKNFQNSNQGNIIGGTIPNGLSIDNIIPIGKPLIDPKAGLIKMNFSLSKYWEVHNHDNSNYDYTSAQLMTPSNSEPYAPATPITFTGFYNEGLTTLPSGEYEITKDVNLAGKFASDVAKMQKATSGSQQWLDTEAINNVKKFIFDGCKDASGNVLTPPLIGGKKEGMTYNDIEITDISLYNNMYAGNPNDITGKLQLKCKMKKMYYLDSNGFLVGPDIDPTIVSDSQRSFTITLTNFEKRNPTNVQTTIDVSLIDGYKDKTVMELKDADLKSLITVENVPTNPNGNFIILQDSTHQIVRDPKNGTITLYIRLTDYYSKNDGIQVTDPNGTVQDNVPIEISFINILKTEPTVLNSNLKVPIDASRYPTLKQKYPQELDKIIKDSVSAPTLDPILKNFKEFILSDIIIKGKLRIAIDDINVTAIKYDNILGELTIDVSLTKYWNDKCEFVDTTTDHSKQPLTGKYVITNLKKSNGQTRIEDNKHVSVSGTSLSFYRYKEFLSNFDTWKADTTSQESIDIRTLIFEQCLSGNRDNISIDNIILESATDGGELVGSQGDHQINVKYKLNSYWDANGAWITSPTQLFTVTFYGFKTNDSTNISSGPFDIIGQEYNKFGCKFGIKSNSANIEYDIEANVMADKLIPSQWIKELTKQGTTAEEQIRNFVVWNYSEMGIIISPPHILEGDPTHIIKISNPQPNDATGEIIFDLELTKICDSSGNEMTPSQPFKKQVTITGFMKKGETTFNDITSLSVQKSPELYNKLIQDPQSPISANKVDIVNGKFEPVEIEPELKKLLFDFAIGGYKPEFLENKDENLSYDNIVIKKIEAQNAFEGTLKITFTLNKWYDQNGMLQIVEKIPEKTIILEQFPIPKPDSNEPTLFPDGPFKISNAPGAKFIGSDNKPIYFADVFINGAQFEGGQITSEAAQKMLENWAWENLIQGNKIGLKEVPGNLNIKILKCDNAKGEITIQYTLKKYYEHGGIPNTENNPKIKEVTITGFKEINPTIINETKFVLTNPNPGNYLLPKYPEIVEKGILSSDVMLSKHINGGTPEDIMSDPSLRENFIYFVKQFIILNSSKIFSNLPGYGNNFEKIDLDQAITLTTLSRTDNNGLSLQLNLSYFINDKGELVGPNANVPLSRTIELSGFKSNKETALKAKNIVINLTNKNGANNVGEVLVDTETKEYAEVYSDLHTELIPLGTPDQPSNPDNGSNEQTPSTPPNDQNQPSNPTQPNNEPLATYESNITNYYWVNSEANSLEKNIEIEARKIGAAPDKNYISDTLINWIYKNNIINSTKTKKSDIVINPTPEWNRVNAYGEISNIKYTINRGFVKDENGNVVEGNIKLEGTIVIKGFVSQKNKSRTQNLILWGTIGGVALGLICIISIVAFIIYRHRKDIQYGY